MEQVKTRLGFTTDSVEMLGEEVFKKGLTAKLH